MKSLLMILCGLVVVVSASDVCYQDVEGACGSTPTNSGDLSKCNAVYGNVVNPITSLQADLQSLAVSHIDTSFRFLLMSSFFGNYEANREGFKTLYRRLSDESWEKGIGIIKYLTKRGGRMNFGQDMHIKRNSRDTHNMPVFEVTELNSLAAGLDMIKKLANETLHIHINAMHHNRQDAAVGHYLEESFMEYHSDTIRELSGYTTELKNLLGGKNREKDASLSLYLFDQYLKQI